VRPGWFFLSSVYLLFVTRTNHSTY
jgi:hypothetical protein